MAPEQAAGESHEVGRPPTVFAGRLALCLITGHPPFQAATPIETLRQVLDQEPVSPRQLNGSVSRDLETICLKCLQKDPARRYATPRPGRGPRAVPGRRADPRPPDRRGRADRALVLA